MENTIVQAVTNYFHVQPEKIMALGGGFYGRAFSVTLPCDSSITTGTISFFRHSLKRSNLPVRPLPSWKGCILSYLAWNSANTEIFLSWLLYQSISKYISWATSVWRMILCRLWLKNQIGMGIWRLWRSIEKKKCWIWWIACLKKRANTEIFLSWLLYQSISKYISWATFSGLTVWYMPIILGRCL